MRRLRRAGAGLVAMALLVGAVIATTAAPAQAGDQCDEAMQGRRVYGLDACDAIIAFADAKTGDLWLTDAQGSEPYRLTHTPMVESDPAGLFPWVFYDGTTKDGSDIYMLSLLDPGAGRIRITGLKTQDFDPTAVMLFEGGGGPVPEDEVGDRAMALGPGGLFFPILLGYSSDRDMNQPKCGYELFAELVTFTGPERITNCNKSDKFDAEWDFDGEQVAYTAYKWNDGIGRIHVAQSNGDDMNITPAGPVRDFPTWNPDCCPSDGPVSSQPAGDIGLNYTQFGNSATSGKLYGIWADGSGDGLWYETGNPKVGFGESEWSASGEFYAAVQWNAAGKAWITLLGKGIGPNVTDKKEFWVQSFDFVDPSMFF